MKKYCGPKEKAAWAKRKKIEQDFKNRHANGNWLLKAGIGFVAASMYRVEAVPGSKCRLVLKNPVKG